MNWLAFVGGFIVGGLFSCSMLMLFLINKPAREGDDE